MVAKSRPGDLPKKTRNKSNGASLLPAEAAESETDYRLLFENSMDAILLSAPDGRIFAANPAACHMFGCAEAEIKRLGRSGLVDAADPRWKAALEERARTGYFRGELTFVRANGTRFPAEVSTSIFQFKDGSAGTSMIIRDVSDRQQAENELKETRELFQKIFSLGPMATTLSKISERTFVDVNTATEKLLGYRRDELIGKPSPDFDYWMDPEEQQRCFEIILSEGKLRDYEFAFKTKSGKIGWAKLYVEILEQHGEKYMLSTFVDVTEHKQAEQEIAWLASFPTQNPNPVVEIDSAGVVSYMNLAAQKRFPDLPSKGFKHPWMAGLENVITGFQGEGSGELQREVQINDEWYSQPLYYVPETRRLRVYGTDITGRKNAERQIVRMERLYATLSQVNQMIVRVKERGELFQTICNVAVQFGEFSLAWVGLLDENSGNVQPVSAKGMDLNTWPFPVVNIHTGPLASGLVAQAIRALKVMTSADLQTDKHLQVLHDQLHKHGFHSSAVVPFRLRGKVIGTLTLLSREMGLFEDVEEVRLLDEMGLDISFALDNMENENERKQAEEQLKESEERYRGLFDHMTEGYAYCQMIFENGVPRDWVYCDINEAFETLTGLKNAKGKRVSEIIPGIRETDPELLAIYARVALTGKHEKFETFVQALKQWFSISVYSPQRGFFVAIFDVITERKRAEEKIQHQLQRLNSLRAIDTAISSSFDIYVTLDIVLQQILSQLSVNAAAVLLVSAHGQTIEYAASRGFRSNALHLTQLKLSEGYASRAVRERRTIHIPNLLAAGGKLAEVMQVAGEDFVDYIGTPLIAKEEIKGVLEIYHRSTLHPDAEWLGFLETLAGQAAIAIDNTQLFDSLQRSNTKLEQRVVERTAELQRANRAKDEFLANMSHELRTPLNTVLGLSETLLEQRRGSLNEKQIQSIELIASSGQHLLGLINDILEVSKIEAGKLELHPTTVSIKELCESSLNFIKEMALKKRIHVEFINEEAIPTLYGDPQRLKQILINLLMNAVKFTPEHGRVSLTVFTDSENDQILFSVKDTGIGIASGDLHRLFTPFTQLDSSLARQYPGTGLGLVLVQKLTDLHGGSVQVESEIGMGSCFTIALPLRQYIPEQVSGADAAAFADAEHPALVPSSSKERGVVLLAEDNEINSRMLVEYLEAQGYRVPNARDGEEVLEKAGELSPDIILMDIQMRKMNGLEATRRLRADPRFASTPIIALTALAMPGDRESCLEAGANEYLSKPVSLKMLLEIIERLTEPTK